MFGGVILSDRDVQAVVISDMWGHVPCWQRMIVFICSAVP